MEHNMHLLFEKGHKAIVAENNDLIANFYGMTWPHLEEIKQLPNGRIHLPTINEQARLQGNMEDTDLWKFVKAPKDRNL